MNTNVKAFLMLIRHGEGTAEPKGYRMMFGGGLINSFSDHPRKAIKMKMGKRFITSTAAGAYQFLISTWDECQKAMDLPDFDPDSQDKAALFLIRRRGALEDVIAGRLFTAIHKCNREWASLPGSPYGQPTTTLAKALEVFEDAGGVNTEGNPDV